MGGPRAGEPGCAAGALSSRCGAFVCVVVVSGATFAGGDGGPAGGKPGCAAGASHSCVRSVHVVFRSPGGRPRDCGRQPPPGANGGRSIEGASIERVQERDDHVWPIEVTNGSRDGPAEQLQPLKLKTAAAIFVTVPLSEMKRGTS